jgi:hypothetical protein
MFRRIGPSRGPRRVLVSRPVIQTCGWFLAAASSLATASIPVPSWFATAPPLPPPNGSVIHVSTADELVAAIERVEPGGTIMVADGLYRVPRILVLRDKRGVTLRSVTGDADRVVLTGGGWDAGTGGSDLLHITRSSGITIAQLTFAEARTYGIKIEAETAPREIHIYDCRFRNIGVRAIKGSASQDPEMRARVGSVRFCRFQNTKVPPAGWLFGGDYIAAIDMMALEDWVFSDNVFRDIKGRNGGARAALFVWVRSRGVVVERNLFVDCDRGVAFGNPGVSTANEGDQPPVYVADGVIRNNFIAGGPDCGIELWYSRGIRVHHNSIWRPRENWRRGIRVGTGTREVDIANNLVHGDILFEGGTAELRGNLVGRLEAVFVDPAAGDLRLTDGAAEAVDQGQRLPDVPEDIGRRARDMRPDLGAWEAMRP